MISETSLVAEQTAFLNLLCRGPECGNIIKYSIAGKKVKRTSASSRTEALVSTVNNGNTYVTVNSFSGVKRKNSNLFAINGIFIDIDGHNLKPDEIVQAKINTVSVINDAIKEGRLCNYTAMTDSGRGIGLLFLYDRSIAAHGNTERQIKFHKSLYNKMIKLIEKLLNEYNGVMLSVDKGVKDAARLCGLPGTYNYNARAYRRNIKINPDARYSLSQIADICGFEPTKKQKKKVNKDMRNVEGLGQSRADKLRRLQASRKDWQGYHHQLCFIYYNTVKLYMDESEAAAALEEFNWSFADYGIDRAEIRGIIRSSKGNGAAYCFTNAYIMNSLNLNEREAAEFKFETAESRELKKIETLKKKLARDKMVVHAILSCETYNEVVCLTGVALRTVKRIASKYFCGHTNGVIKKLEDVDWGMFDINRYYVCKKSAKNCHVDVNEYIHDTSDKQIAVDKSTVERGVSANNAHKEDTVKKAPVKEAPVKKDIASINTADNDYRQYSATNINYEEDIMRFDNVTDDLDDLNNIFTIAGRTVEEIAKRSILTKALNEYFENHRDEIKKEFPDFFKPVNENPDEVWSETKQTKTKTEDVWAEKNTSYNNETDTLMEDTCDDSDDDLDYDCIDDLWNEAGQNKTSYNIVHTDGINFNIEETDEQDDDWTFDDDMDDDDNDCKDVSYHHSNIRDEIIKNHNIKMLVSTFFEEKEYSDDNTCYVDEVKHSYGLSFLSYLNVTMEGNMKRVIEITKDMLYHMTDKSILEQALSGLDYLADQYSYDPELKAAVYDIEHMMRAVENGHFSFNLHGLMSSVPEAHDTYPVMYEPVDSIDTMFDKLKDDFDGCNVKTITDNAENVRKWFKVIIASRGWRECIIDGVTIFRDDLVKAMKRLNINDMCSIINKAGALKGYKWHKKLYVQDTFIEYRELFYRQCAAKGYM